MITVRVQSESFDPGVELALLAGMGGGAVASFTGLVRGNGGLTSLTLEHYPAMTQSTMEQIAQQADQRWPLLGVTVIHRYGRLVPGDRIVFVGVASSHRAASLEACAFLIDWLKTDAPFWKREEWADGTAKWVDAKADDDATKARWE